MSLSGDYGVPNPSQFALSSKLYILILPRLAFILGRIALIFQNRFLFTNFFRNFALIKRLQKTQERLWTGSQRNNDTAQQIEELNGKIRELVERESPSLLKGKLLYEDIKNGGTTSGWSNDDYKCFIDYYKAIDFPAFCRIQKKYTPKTAHNTVFLILYEMGLDDKDVRRIMGITQEAIRFNKVQDSAEYKEVRN